MPTSRRLWSLYVQSPQVTIAPTVSKVRGDIDAA